MTDTTDSTKGFWTYGRMALAALGVILIVVAVSTSRSTRRASAGSPLPAGIADAEILSLDGGPFRLSDYRGRVVVLDLWATWCGPCRMEIPHLVELREEYGPRGVEVIGLSVEDPVSDEETVRDFAREFSINYKLGWAEEDWFLKLTRGNTAIPQTFVIGRDGGVYLHAPGYSPQLPQMIRDAIARAENGGA